MRIKRSALKPIGRCARVGLLVAALGGASAASAATLHLNSSPAWMRPSSAAAAAATHTLYAEWNGFAVVAATNQPTGNSYFGAGLTPVPTAGDSKSATSGSFIIANGTANNDYYTSTSVGDIYSFSGVIAPQIVVPGYNIAGNRLNVLVQAEDYGAGIDTSLLMVNGVAASSLLNYSVSQTYSGDGSVIMGTEVFHNDYAWRFTLPADTSLLTLNFGWSATPSEGFVAAVIDTQSVPAPEPASVVTALIGGGLLAAWGVRRRLRLRDQL